MGNAIFYSPRGRDIRGDGESSFLLCVHPCLRWFLLTLSFVVLQDHFSKQSQTHTMPTDPNTGKRREGTIEEWVKFIEIRERGL
jgi:hypothetical protein